jgi:hypothetical protein
MTDVHLWAAIAAMKRGLLHYGIGSVNAAASKMRGINRLA